MDNNGNRFGLLSILVTLATFTYSLAGVPRPDVTATLITVSGDTVCLKPGDSGTESFTVPLRVQLSSSITSDDGREYILFPEWQLIRSYQDGETLKSDNYLKRQESNTEYEITDHGSFQVIFSWSYRDKDSINTILGYEIAPMSFVVDDSRINLYNAFSPNNDGINDDYKIYLRSIVSVEITIFNRWGQVIKSISGRVNDIMTPEDEATRDADGGFLIKIWDGKHNGRVVADGVYFINVRAVGAGGKKYERKSDINVLTGTGIQ